MKIRVKCNDFGCLPQIMTKGDWIDLRSSEEISMSAPQAGASRQRNGELVRDVLFDFHLIPLGVAMQLPKGFEAIVAPRSSTFKKYGLLQANSIGVIDNSYCGDSDIWLFPAVSTSPVTIPKHTRICQFRIQLSQTATLWQRLKWLFCHKIKFEKVQSLGNISRGGFGSSDKHQ